MSYVLYFDKDEQPVRQMVSTDPDLASRYRRVTVFTQDEVDDMIDNAEEGAGGCCSDCRADHYNDGYADAEREAEARIEELRDAIESMLTEIDSARLNLDDAVGAASCVGVTA